ncbi:50S ribosomal protein L34e (modular protein) [groundwater metagenome]|uniref:50S ribosomal protein L34e (Modular protein) n=1 Tax=groundwater metagenome TaxID=717931 RepID=A0A098EB36_9ZZZZ
MVNRQLRSTTIKRLIRKTPGGKVVTIYKPKKTGKHICGRCGQVLNVPYDQRKVRKLSKSEKIPSRPYPMLCSKCAEEVEKYKAMADVKFKFKFDANFDRDLTIEKFLQKGWFEKISASK